jgi:arylsulfatase A-like enzyme
MLRLKALVFLAVVFTCGLPVRSAGAGPVAPRPPNIVFFLIDDWGWTDLGSYGSKFYQTPNMDRLAAEGMKFTQAYSACTVCSPTRAATMTGKYPARLRVTDYIPGNVRPFAKLRVPEWTMHLPLSERTIAEELKTRGYVTGHFGKWHLGGAGFEPEKQGFDVNFGGGASGAPGGYFPPYGVPATASERGGELLTDRITREVVTFIETNRNQPFFAYVPHYAVHTPLQAKREVIEKYQKRIATGMLHTNAVYAALLESVDDSVGVVLQKLRELNLEQNTVIFLTGDNGGLTRTIRSGVWGGPLSTDNSPLRAGKGSAYEGGVRVPLIVKWPGVIRSGSVDDVTPVISPDFFPTILDLAGAPAAGRPVVDGVSLDHVLRGAGRLSRDAVFWHYPHYHAGGATPYSAVRAGDWKLIHFFEDDHVELYNLRQDLSETNNLAKTEFKRATELRIALEAWRTKMGAQLPTENPSYDPSRQWENQRGDLKNGGTAAPKKKARSER